MTNDQELDDLLEAFRVKPVEPVAPVEPQQSATPDAEGAESGGDSLDDLLKPFKVDAVEQPAMGGIESMISQIAEEEGLGEYAPLLIGLARTESGLDPRAQNPESSAGGLFQFIDDTAKRYGLDDKFDPEKNARAAVRMFRDHLEQFGGDPRLALAAHHVGAGKAEQALSDSSVGDINISTQDWLEKVVRNAGELGISMPKRPVYSNDQIGMVDVKPFEERQRRQIASDESPFTTNLERGWEMMKRSAGDAVDIYQGDFESILERAKEWDKFDQENPQPSSTRQFMEDFKDENYLDSLMNVEGALGAMSEQLANSIPAMAGSIPGSILGGMTGFAVGGPVGAAIGATAGGAAGALPGNVTVETGARWAAMAAEDGVDFSDQKQVYDWLVTNRGKIIDEGLMKGTVVSAFDGLTQGVGSAIMMQPAMRFAQTERRVLASLGVDASNQQALAAARKTAAYRNAMAPYHADLKAASSVALQAMRGTAAFVLETAGEIGGEYLGEVAATGEGNLNDALLEGVLAGGQSLITTGAGYAANKAYELSQGQPAQPAAPAAGNAGQNPAPTPTPSEIAGGMVPPSGDQGPGSFSQMNEFADFIAQERADVQARRDAIGQPFNEMTGVDAGYDPANRARNQVGAPAGSFGQMNEFAELLGQEQADVTDRRGAIAAEQQADLADLISQETADVDARRAQIAEAQAAGTNVQEARLQEIAENVEAGRDAETRAARRAVLDEILADPTTVNPLERFRAELGRRRFSTTTPTTDELATIAKFEDIRSAEVTSPEVAGAMARAQVAQPGRNKIDEIKSLVGQGWKISGKTLVSPTGKKRNLNAVEFAAAKEAARKATPTTTGDIENADQADQAQQGEQAAPPEDAAAAVAPEAPKKKGGRPIKPDLDLIERARRFADDIRAMAPSAGWAEKGGLMTRDADGNVGRTKWIPHAEWFGAGMEHDPDILAAHVEDLLAGKGVPIKSRRSVEGMLEWINSRREMAAGDPDASSYDFDVAEFDSKTEDQKLVIDAYDDFDSDTPADEAAAMRALGFTEEEINAATRPAEAEEGARGAQEDVAAGEGGNARSNQDPVGQEAQAGSQAGADREGLTLDSYTPEELAQREAAQKEREAAEAKAKRDADEKERQERERAEIRRRSEAAADTFELGGDPMQNLTGQGGLFDAPAPKPEIKTELDAAAHAAATSPLNDLPQPTDKQKEAGNYKVGKVRLQGMDISIENPRGSVRSGTAPDGTRWENTLAHHYGYVNGSRGADGDQIDVFLTDGAEDASVVWVIDQKNKDGSFDEHKGVIGPATEEEARAAYLANYDAGWDGLGAISSMPVEAFRAWAMDGKRKKKPLAYVQAEAKPAEAAPAEETRVVSSAPFVSFKEMKTALKLFGDVEAIRERLRDMNVANIPAKDSVSVPNKMRWDEVRANVPVRIDQYRVAGVPERLADVTIEVMESGAAVLKSQGTTMRGDSVDAVIASYVESYSEQGGQQDQTTAQAEAPQKNALPDGVTARRIKIDGNPAVEVTLPSGKVHRIERIAGAGSMALTGWHDADKGLKDYSYLGETQQQAIIELMDREKRAAAKSKAGDRPNPGDPGYTLEMAEEDLAAIREKNRGQYVSDARMLDKQREFEKLVQEMRFERGLGGGFKAGDAVRVRGQDDKIRYVDQIGEDGWIYLKDGAVFRPEQVREVLYKSEPAPDKGMSVPTDVSKQYAAEQAAKVAAAPQSAADTIKAAGLTVTATKTKNGNPVWEVKGNTRDHSETLKRLGGRWYGPKKAWSFYDADPSAKIAEALKPQQPASAAAPKPESTVVANIRQRIQEAREAEEEAKTVFGARGFEQQTDAVLAMGEQARWIDADRRGAISLFRAPNGELVYRFKSDRGAREGDSPNQILAKWDDVFGDGGATAVDLRGKAPGDVLLNEYGEDHRIDEIDAKTGRVRMTKNRDKLSEQSVLLGQSEFDRLVLEDKENRPEPAKPASQETVDPKSLDEMRAALMAGKRVHFDYAGADGRTLWVEASSPGHVVKSMDDGSTSVWTKGGDPRRGGFSKEEAVAAALADAEYRFTQWKPLADQQGAVDAVLAEKVKTLTDRDVPQSQIDAAVSEYKDGDATLIDDLLRITKPEEKEQASPDFDAMFDEILAEEMPAQKARAKRKPAAEKARPAAESKPRKPRTAGEAAKSAAKNTASGLADAIDGLGKLFGGNGRLSSGLTFDEETYAKAKPLFKSAISHLKDANNDIKDVMRAIVRMVLDKFGPHVAANMKPYVTQFVKDVHDGKIDYDENEGTTNQGDSNGNGPAGQDQEGSGGDQRKRRDLVEDTALDDRQEAEGTQAGRGGSRDGRGSGPVAPDEDVGGGSSISEGGDVLDGRAGTGGTGVAGSGPAGGRRGNPGLAAGRGNYRITDPEALIGGSPKVRFARNKKAIEAFIDITNENRAPTKDELDAMAGYIGWGSFGQELFQGSFDYTRPKDGWQNESEWLKKHLGKDGWESAQSSIINAHYTDPITVSTMWDMVRQLGFKGGRVLEPSMGVGNFFGLMPADLAERSNLTGIELDTTTGGMAKLLYPDANIQIKGYEKSATPDNFYDLVIGNWPFAKDTPFVDRRYMKINPSLHDYFFLKALDQVRPGGLVVGITSAGTMDKQGKLARASMAQKADLVAAFRLPSGAFEKYAGTSVVTDIIILRKRETPNTEVEKSGWLNTQDVMTPGGKATVNEYFAADPGKILGKLNFGNGSTYGRPSMIVDRPANLLELMAKLPDSLPKNVMTPREKPDNTRYITNNIKDREQSVVVADDGDLYVVQGERLAALSDLSKFAVKDEKKTASRVDQVKRLVGLRKAYGSLIDSERDGEANVESLRKDLKKQYDAFKKAHGTIFASEGISILKSVGDPFVPSLLSLENRDGSPAAIMSKPTIRARRKIDSPSVRDALVLARNEDVDVDIDRVAEIAGVSREEAAAQLMDAGQLFMTPTGNYEVRDVYLSGNVRRKLREAQAALEEGVDLARNIEALQQVVPKDVPYFNIEAKLGATWVRPEQYREFIGGMLGVTDTSQIEVKFAAGRWKVRFKNSSLNHRSEATSLWGHPLVRFDRLLTAAFGNVSIKVWTKDDEGNKVIDEKASAEANERAAKVREEFSSWVWKDPARRIEMERTYNDVMNAIATPDFDGSFLTFEGMALQRGSDAFSLRKHQIDAIWRGLANGRGLYAHEVGTGKTYTMGGLAVESRRYGLAKKPIIFAHNANSASVAREISEMYPGAKLLYVDNLDKTRIDVTMRQIANDEWDAIIVPHSLIKNFALREDTLKELAREEIAMIEMEALEAAQEDGVALSASDFDDEDAMKKVRSVTAKQLVKQRNQILKRIADMAVRSSKEGAISFEDMGVDMVIVDEAHEFKKPSLTTRMQIRGLNKNTSSQSLTLQLLTGYVKKINNGRGVHLFTGTPITNTMNEIYNHMRFVADDQMERDGLKDWDAWFAAFADATNDVELTATGQYEPVKRLASFVNVAELRRMAGQYLDIVFADDMPEFTPRETSSGKTLESESLTDKERDYLVNGRNENPVGRPYKKVIVDTAEMSPAQVSIFEELQARANRFRNADKKTRREYQMSGAPESPVLVETAASNAGIDARLFDMSADDHADSKMNRAIRNVVKHYKEHPKATQVVFVDRGNKSESTSTKTNPATGEKVRTKSARFNLVAEMIDKLVKSGIKREQIAVIDGTTSKEKRKDIADAMNRAEIRVVIGSTKTLGVGVNMQENLRAMHHIDAPWMPGELEQRNGRGHRQGNKWNTVLEYRYITERIDGRRWQVLSIKDRFIKSFLKADESVRVIEGDAVSMDEDGDISSTLSEAAGDPRILIINKLKSDITLLENKERIHSSGIFEAQQEVKNLRGAIDRNTEKAKSLRQDAETYKAMVEEPFSATILGVPMKDQADTNKAFEDAINALYIDDGKPRVIGTEIGEIWGAQITADKVKMWNGIRVEIFASINGNTYELGKPSVASFRQTLAGLGRRADGLDEESSDMRQTISRLEEMIVTPFGRAEDLAKKRRMLDDIEADLVANPVPAPSWLRNGAPAETEVRVGVEPAIVQGHRWTSQGYFVTVSDKSGGDLRDIPYMEVLDGNGLPVFEEREFVAPKVQDATSQPKDGDAAPVIRSRPRPGGYQPSSFRAQIDTNPSEEVLRDVGLIRERIGQAIAGAGVSAAGWSIEPAKVPDAARGMVAGISRLFGINIRFVRAEGLPADVQFNGMYVGRNSVFVNVDSDTPFSQVIGHEFLHYLRHAAPDLYQDFIQRALPALKLGQLRSAADIEADAYRKFGLPEDDAKQMGFEEVYADVFGDAWGDPKFWEALAGQDLKVAQKALAALKRFIFRIKAMLMGERGNPLRENLYKDFDRVRDTVLDTSKKFAEGGYQPYQGLAATRFSLSLQRPIRAEMTRDEMPWPSSGKEPIVVFHNTDEAAGFTVREGLGFGGIFAGPRGGMQGSKTHAVILDPDRVMSHADFKYEVEWDDYVSALQAEIPVATREDAEALYDFISEDKDSADLEAEVDYNRLFRGQPMSDEPGWAIQSLRGRVAARLGYQAAEMKDETGRSYFIAPGVRTFPLLDGESRSDAEARIYEAWKSGVRFSKAGTGKNQWVERGRNENGPVFAGDGIVLDPVREIPAETDFDDGGMAEHGLMGHAAWVDPGNAVYEFAIYEDGKKAGLLVAEVADQDIVAIHDFEVYTKRNGTGRRVVDLIAGSSPEDVRVVEALEQSEGFWKGVGANETDQYGNTTIPRRARQGSQSDQGRGAGAQDLAGSEGDDGINVQDATEEEVELLRSAGYIQYRRKKRQTGKGITAEQFRAALVDRFGEKGVQALEAQGLLNVVDLNDPDLGGNISPNNPAWYHIESGRAFFVPAYLESAEDAVASVLHEIGTHHALPEMLGERGWRVLKGRIASLARTDDYMRAVWDGVIANYGHYGLGNLKGKEPSADALTNALMHEIIAKIGETAAGRKSSIWRDILAAVNRFLLKMGFSKQINKNELADLVEGALKRTMANASRPTKAAGSGRPTTDSRGKTIHPTAEGQRNFWRWFGDSKVVDEQGRPLVVYHGTTRDVSEFKRTSALGGFYFSADSMYSSMYAGQEDGANMIPAYLSMSNPLVINGRGFDAQSAGAFKRMVYAALRAVSPRFKDYSDAVNWMESNKASSTSLSKEEIDWLKSIGFDGIINNRMNEIVVFDPAQIKSAIGNAGTFDGSDPNILNRINFNPADYMPGAAQRAADARSQYAEQNRKLREQHRGVWDKSKSWLKRHLAPGGLLPGEVFAEKIKRDSEFEAVEFDTKHLIGQLERAVSDDYGISASRLDEEVQRLLSAALTGDIDPSIPEATKVALLGMRQYIDRLSVDYISVLQQQADELLAQAAATGDGRLRAEAEARAALMQTIAGNVGQYVHRSYRAFDDPKWFEKVPTEVVDAAREYLTGRVSEYISDPAAVARRVEVIIHEMLKTGTAYENMEGFIKESKLGAKDLSVLKKRKEIAPEIRALLGEYTDPRVNFAKSSTKMGRLIWNQRFLDRLREIGMGTFFWTEGDKPPEATSKIAGDASEVYAPLNGLWTTPEINQAFKDALGKEQMADWYRTIVKYNGYIKYGKTVLSPTTLARNWMSAFFFPIANGHFDMRHYSKSLDAVREYLGTNSDAERMAYLRKLKQLGVVYDTPYAQEMMRTINEGANDDGLVRTGGRLKTGVMKTLDLATALYGLGDDVQKIMGFENEKARWIEAGFSEAEAEVKAAERIRNTYPTYSMVGQSIQWLRRFPIMGTFVSFPAEIIRTSINMVRYLKEDWADPRTRPMAVRRLIGMGLVTSFAYALQHLSMALLGFDDDDDEAVRQMAAPWQKNSSFVFLGRDEKGNIKYLDISFLDPYNYLKRPLMAFSRDQSFDDAAKSAITDIASPFVGTDIAAGAIFDVLANKKDSGQPVYQDHDSAINQTVAIANHLRKAIQPGIAANIERTWAAMEGDVSPSGKQYMMSDELAAWVGFRVSTLDPKVALYYRSFEFADAKAQAEKSLRDTIREPGEVSSEELREAHEITVRRRKEAFEQMHVLVQSARKAGLTNAEISGALRNAGISALDAGMIVRGQVTPWKPNKATIKKTAEKAANTFGPDARKQVMDRYRELAEIE